MTTNYKIKVVLYKDDTPSYTQQIIDRDLDETNLDFEDMLKYVTQFAARAAENSQWVDIWDKVATFLGLVT